jgi:hypothetical protein
MTDTEICEELPLVLPNRPRPRFHDIMRRAMVPPVARWNETTAQNLAEVTDILDRLENSGVGELTLELNGVEGFVVRWK